MNLHLVGATMANESWQRSVMMGWDEKNRKMAPAGGLDLPRVPVKG